MLDWIAVALLGALVGVSELVSRYRDAPFRALTTLPAAIYLAVNASAALAALALLRAFGWTFGLPETSSSGDLHLIQVLVAGFGAMALFRSSLFNVRIVDQDVAVGPSAFLFVVLSAADAAVDRCRAKARAKTVSRVMSAVSFEKSHRAIPTLCLALMQNLSTEEQEQFGNQVTLLREDAVMEDEVKALALGLTVMNMMGPDVLEEVVDTLGARIKV